MRLTGMHERQHRLPARQRGVSLFVSLIFMVLLTIVVVTAMRVTGLEERMAGNMRDRDLAFQAAEAAMREAEKVLQAASLPTFDNSGCYYPYKGTSVVLRNTSGIWSGSASCVVTTVGGVAASPRYIIEELPPIPASASGGTASFGALPDVGVYRVTARSVGGTSNAVVMLEGTYRR
jgi:type IV pilus assembly protein PilX